MLPRGGERSGKAATSASHYAPGPLYTPRARRCIRRAARGSEWCRANGRGGGLAVGASPISCMRCKLPLLVPKFAVQRLDVYPRRPPQHPPYCTGQGEGAAAGCVTGAAVAGAA